MTPDQIEAMARDAYKRVFGRDPVQTRKYPKCDWIVAYADGGCGCSLSLVWDEERAPSKAHAHIWWPRVNTPWSHHIGRSAESPAAALRLAEDAYRRLQKTP